MTRPRDLSYEALAEVTGTDMNAGRGELNAALKSIREQSPLLDGFLLSQEIEDRALAYRRVMGEGVLLTPSALAKHWKRVFEQDRKFSSRAVNLHVDVSCSGCGGNRFILSHKVPPVQTAWMRIRGIAPRIEYEMEVMRRCPACNT